MLSFGALLYEFYVGYDTALAQQLLNQKNFHVIRADRTEAIKTAERTIQYTNSPEYRIAKGIFDGLPMLAGASGTVGTVIRGSMLAGGSTLVGSGAYDMSNGNLGEGAIKIGDGLLFVSGGITKPLRSMELNGVKATSLGQANAATGAALNLDLKTTQAANEVVESLRATGKLPSYYVTKGQAIQKGWKVGTALDNYVPGGQIGGDVFRNLPRILPTKSGRVWYEADIGLNGSMSRAKQAGTRLLYSNDGLLYITTDHYQTVKSIGKWK